MNKLIMSSTDLWEVILISYKEGMCEGFHKEKSLQHHLIDVIRRIWDWLTYWRTKNSYS